MKTTLIPVLSLTTVLLFSACGSDKAIDVIAQGQIQPGEPATPPSNEARDLLFSNEIWEPNENKIEIDDPSVDVQTFLYRFPDSASMKIELARGSTFAMGCEMSVVQQKYFLVTDGEEKEIQYNVVTDKATAKDAFVKVVVSGLSQCMGYGSGFLIIRR